MGYMGVGISEFPNTFTMLGPYSPITNSPTLIAIEAQAYYICAFIDRYQTEPKIHSMMPTLEACADFKAHVDSFMKVESLLYGLEAPSITSKPFREPRFEHWQFSYHGNRFAWLGNSGISQVEWDPTTDLAYYIREDDHGAPWASRWKRNLVTAKTGSMPARVLHRRLAEKN